MSSSDEETLEGIGWRQHSIIGIEAHPDLEKIIPDYDSQALYIVLPYSCAVVNEEFVAKEPFIELIKAVVVTNVSKQDQFGRNPRKLQLALGGERLLNLNIHDRCFIPHAFLSDVRPCEEFVISPQQKDALNYWITRRYIRSVFPTEFLSRAGGALQRQLDRIKNSTEPFVDDLLGIYLIVDPGHEIVEQNELYEVSIFVLVTEEGRVRDSQRLDGLKNDLDEALSNCHGVEVSQSKYGSETSILLSEFRQMIRLDNYDFISLRGGQAVLEPLQ